MKNQNSVEVLLRVIEDGTGHTEEWFMSSIFTCYRLNTNYDEF